MDREMFPTLERSSHGWPVLVVPMADGGRLEIQVAEDDEQPNRAVVTIGGTGVTYMVDPVQSTQCWMHTDEPASE